MMSNEGNNMIHKLQSECMSKLMRVHTSQISEFQCPHLPHEMKLFIYNNIFFFLLLHISIYFYKDSIMILPNAIPSIYHLNETSSTIDT